MPVSPPAPPPTDFRQHHRTESSRPLPPRHRSAGPPSSRQRDTSTSRDAEGKGLSTQDLIASAAARPHLSRGIEAPTMERVWTAVCGWVEEHLLRRKGIVLPRFGHFAFRQVEMDEGTWGAKLNAIPTFVMNPAYATQFRLGAVKHVPASSLLGPIQTVTLNSIVIALSSGTTREVVGDCFREVVKRFGDEAALGKSTTLDFGFCRITSRGNRYTTSWSDGFMEACANIDNQHNHKELKLDTNAKRIQTGAPVFASPLRTRSSSPAPRTRSVSAQRAQTVHATQTAAAVAAPLPMSSARERDMNKLGAVRAELEREIAAATSRAQPPPPAIHDGYTSGGGMRTVHVMPKGYEESRVEHQTGRPTSAQRRRRLGGQEADDAAPPATPMPRGHPPPPPPPAHGNHLGVHMSGRPVSAAGSAASAIRRHRLQMSGDGEGHSYGQERASTAPAGDQGGAKRRMQRVAIGGGIEVDDLPQQGFFGGADVLQITSPVTAPANHQANGTFDLSMQSAWSQPEWSPFPGKSTITSVSALNDLEGASRSQNYWERRRHAKAKHRGLRKKAYADSWAEQIRQKEERQSAEKEDDRRRAEAYLQWSAEAHKKEMEKQHNARTKEREIGAENIRLLREQVAQQLPKTQPMGHLFEGWNDITPAPPDMNFLKSQVEEKRKTEEDSKKKEAEAEREMGRKMAEQQRLAMEAERIKKSQMQASVAAAYQRQIDESYQASVRPGFYDTTEDGGGNIFFKNRSPLELASDERRERAERRRRLRELSQRNMDEETRAKEERRHHKVVEMDGDRAVADAARKKVQEQMDKERNDRLNMQRTMKSEWDKQVSVKEAHHRALKDEERSFRHSTYWKNESSDEEDEGGSSVAYQHTYSHSHSHY